MEQKNELNTKKKNKKADRRGFYAALAICVIAIGIAAWSTYDTMADFLTPLDTPAESSDLEKVNPVRKEETIVDAPAPTVAENREQAATEEADADIPAEEIEVESVAAPTEAPKATPVPQVKTVEAAAPAAVYTESEQYIRPVENAEVLSPYSEVPVYSETMRDYRVHTGADYKAERGETVHAAANGIVKSTHTDMLLGNMIVIDHGGAEISYCGLGGTFLVKPGEVVERGQDIGSITAAPFESTMEPHLHLEAVQHGKNVDPETLFK